jgi:epoxyqueuosine reductase
LATPYEIRELFQERARKEGFAGCGIAPASRPDRFEIFEDWIGSGMSGDMAYLAESAGVRGDAARLLEGARSVVVLAHPHRETDWRADDGSRIARYAAGDDYHRVLREKCRRIVRSVRESPGVPSFADRICVDSAPLLERAFAARAGLGWIGKNGMLMNAESGSRLLLCEILLDLELPEDSPVAEQCASCARCLESCPTEAFERPGVLDARRCLSYWTIEQRGVIPPEIVDRMGGHVFGCDICQDVCPYNGAGAPGPTAVPPPSLEDWLTMGSAEWKRRFQGTAIARAGAAGMRRNAAAAAQATGRTNLLPVLERIGASSHPVAAPQARRAAAALRGRST